MLARNLLEISFSFEVKNEMPFDAFVETDKRRLVGCTFHVIALIKNKKNLKKKLPQILLLFSEVK